MAIYGKGSPYQREAILRCLRCKYEWKVFDNKKTNILISPCPKCEGFKTVDHAR